MLDILYSHRLKSSLQQLVRDLGLSLSLDDEGANLSLRDNEKMLTETAQALGLQVHIQDHETGTTVTFFK